MPTRLALLICLLVITAPNSLPAAPPPTSPSTETYGPALTPRKVNGIDACQAVAVVGNRLYATGRGKFHVLDITRPEKPVPLGELSGLGNTRQLFIKGNIAYITARQDGLWLVDISAANKPQLLSHYDTVEMATGISVSGSLAFVATRQYGVEIIDVSNPRAPQHVSMLKTGEAQSCWSRDGILYIGDWAPRKLVIADVRNPRQPTIISEAPLDGFGDGGCLRGNYCFAATGHHSRGSRDDGKGHGLEIFNVADPKQPTFVSRVKFPASYHISNDMWTVRVAGDHCVVADTWNGLFVVNIHDIKQPRIVAHAVLPPRSKSDNTPDPVGGIALGKGVIYAAGIFTGLYVVPAPGLATPVVREQDQAPELKAAQGKTGDPRFLTYQPGGQVRSATVVGDIAWAACGSAGIHAVQLGKTLEPVSVTKGKGEVMHLAVSGSRLYAAENDAGLAIYDIGPELKLTEIGRLKLKNRNVKQVACPAPGRFALYHWCSSAVEIADLQDPAHPKVVLKDSQVGLFYGDQLVPELLGGRYLVAYWHRSGPAWYDVSGEKPVYQGNTPDERRFSFTDGVCLRDDKLLLVKHGKLQLLNPGDQREVSQLPAITVPGHRLRGRPTTDGKQLALSRRSDQKVELFDITDIQHPKPIREYDLKGHPGACRFWNSQLLIPAGYQGLLLERKTKP
ncbi:LVIVD repeat protein [Gimesia chilikensis]|uniref:LVIVD repeat protein n=2 Tax=Gimesia chilikensis TaxID=2605989 RepID=A0A517W6Y3_9PLAN|nr:LVIVD repeat protein [Gimesia chilikensis]